ncbi:MAG TPA: caspase family protein [Caulobacteraceae bacterium]|nr:caspase family protein [Caulobacteraceae bacterium]
MPRLFAIAAAIVLAALALGGLARADAPRRVALVIANADYVSGGSLKNPINDASLIEAALKKAGFQLVHTRENLGTGAFNHALRAFSAEAAGAEAAVIYFAGHGVEAQGTNWLLPTDVTLQSPSDLEYEAIDINKVLRATQGAKVRMVVLDACRNNPFTRTRSWTVETRATQGGLGEVSVDDVLVLYSAAPGETALDGTGADSPFAQALAQRLPEPGLEIHVLGGKVRDDVLRMTGVRQRPYVSASISGDTFYFVPGNATANPAGAAAPAAPVFDVRQADTVLWISVGSSNDVGQLNAYLAQFPNGIFAGAAKAKLAALTRPAGAVPTAATPGSGGVALDDLAAQNAELRAKWDRRQKAMQADFDKVAAFQGPPDLRRAAWGRFLAAYGDKNPYTGDDERLRAEAAKRRVAIQDPPKAAAAARAGIAGAAPTAANNPVFAAFTTVCGAPAADLMAVRRAADTHGWGEAGAYADAMPGVTIADQIGRSFNADKSGLILSAWRGTTKAGVKVSDCMVHAPRSDYDALRDQTADWLAFSAQDSTPKRATFRFTDTAGSHHPVAASEYDAAAAAAGLEIMTVAAETNGTVLDLMMIKK